MVKLIVNKISTDLLIKYKIKRYSRYTSLGAVFAKYLMDLLEIFSKSQFFNHKMVIGSIY